MRKEISFVFLILTIFAVKMASSDIYERRDVYGREEKVTKGSTKTKNFTKTKMSDILPGESSTDVSEFVNPGRNEAPTDGGFNKGVFDGIIDDVKGGGVGSGLMGGTGMAPFGSGGSGGDSGGSSGGSSGKEGTLIIS